MKADVTTLEAKTAGSVELPDDVFALEPRADLIQRMVTYQLAKRQAGTHKTKGRSEVSGTTKKFVRQKGSGGARHGNRKVPQFRGGGKAFGPVVRSHAIDLPKKVRTLALKHALSAKVKAEKLIVLDEAKLQEAKTAGLRSSLAKLGWTSALIIDGAELDNNFALASRNIPSVDVLPVQGINVYDILRRDTLVLTKAALEGLEARFK
ncbi:MAG: 50S ribosomal protein L4 [Alphaproteobacteria bacterium]|jgi:large subunit ribosomal protein L4|nr:50S ribosomal protein L4 [Alphaproteobacteria bacterium]MBO6628261.1 50S ribosomal protein L4 [Alphaproteobacteria bacterium]MDF1624648.1 50S ribosomal protein L4 [Parvibaculaceae bacterium]